MPLLGSAQLVVPVQIGVDVPLLRRPDQTLPGSLEVRRDGRLGFNLRLRQLAVVVVVELAEIAPIVALSLSRADEAVAVLVIDPMALGRSLNLLSRSARNRRLILEIRRRRRDRVFLRRGTANQPSEHDAKAERYNTARRSRYAHVRYSDLLSLERVAR